MTRARRPLALLCAVGLALLATNAIAAAAGDAHARLRVTVGIAPQAYLVDQLGGELVTTDVLIRPGQSPHQYEPTPKQVAAVMQSALLVATGMPFEKQLAAKVRATHKGLQIVDPPIVPAAHDDHDYQHGDADPHFWLDPGLAARHAEDIAKALAALLPDRRTEIEANLARFRDRLDALDRDLSARLAPLAGSTVLVTHPAYGHLLSRYALKQLAVEVNGKEPGPKHLVALVDRARRENAKIVLVQPQHPSPAARTLARELRIEVVDADPLLYDLPQAIGAIGDAVARAHGR